MHHIQILELLAFGLFAALVLGLITHRLKISPIVGYLLAGFLVGPNSPGYVADANLTAQLSEVGVILLMFGVGLHFNLKDLLAVRKIAVPGAVAQIAFATMLGAVVALAVGMSLSAGLILGLGLSVASTVVLIRVLMDNRMLDTSHGHIAVGWLIVEDIFTVLVLVLLPSIAVIVGHRAGAETNLAFSLAFAVFKLVSLWILILPIGGLFIPWLMSLVARTRSRELFILTTLVIAFMIATGSAVIFGASVALGAFLAGMVVGKTTVSHQAASDILPMRDAFAVLFFLSVGMLFDPAFLLERPFFVLSCLLIILVAKPLIAGVVVIVLGYSVRTALTVAIALSQIGEFSFILGQHAMKLDLLPEKGYSVLIAGALISITLNPILFKALGPTEQWLQGQKRLWRLLNRQVEKRAREINTQTREQLERHEAESLALVVGYGPVGQRVTHLLKVFDFQPVIIDLNVDTIHKLTAEGLPAVYGDSSQADILKEAGVERAAYLLITLPDITDTIATITKAQELNPEIRILVRSRYLGSKPLLEGLGVSGVAYEEDEVAKAMAALLFRAVKGTSH